MKYDMMYLCGRVGYQKTAKILWALFTNLKVSMRSQLLLVDFLYDWHKPNNYEIHPVNKEDSYWYIFEIFGLQVRNLWPKYSNPLNNADKYDRRC